MSTPAMGCRPKGSHMGCISVRFVRSNWWNPGARCSKRAWHSVKKRNRITCLVAFFLFWTTRVSSHGGNLTQKASRQSSVMAAAWPPGHRMFGLKSLDLKDSFRWENYRKVVVESTKGCLSARLGAEQRSLYGAQQVAGNLWLSRKMLLLKPGGKFQGQSGTLYSVLQ